MYCFGWWFKPLPQAPLSFEPSKGETTGSIVYQPSLPVCTVDITLLARFIVTAVENKIYMYKLGQGTQCTKCWNLVMQCRFCPCSTNTGTNITYTECQVPCELSQLMQTMKTSYWLILSYSSTDTTRRGVPRPQSGNKLPNSCWE